GPGGGLPGGAVGLTGPGGGKTGPDAGLPGGAVGLTGAGGGKTGPDAGLPGGAVCLTRAGGGETGRAAALPRATLGSSPRHLGPGRVEGAHGPAHAAQDRPLP